MAADIDLSFLSFLLLLVGLVASLPVGLRLRGGGATYAVGSYFLPVGT